MANVRLAAGIYAVDGELHLDTAEILRDYGLPVTPENEARLEAAAYRRAAELGIPCFTDEEVVV